MKHLSYGHPLKRRKGLGIQAFQQTVPCSTQCQGQLCELRSQRVDSLSLEQTKALCLWGRLRLPRCYISPHGPCLLPGRLPTHQIIRCGSKAVTRHRRVMHFERQKLMAVTEYIAPKPVVNPRCLPPPPSPPKEVRRRLGMSPEVGWWVKVILSLWP